MALIAGEAASACIPQVGPAEPVQLSIRRPVFADVTGDRRVDALRFDRAALLCAPNLDGRTFGAEVSTRLVDQATGEPRYVDVDGDGVRDIVTAFSSGTSGGARIGVLVSNGAC
ncbi:MAG: hypothetical protein JNK60_01050, partial [Acidobacteria bacterium]|nr:hypothetical protein [Acidobacteriota bacterium]